MLNDYVENFKKYVIHSSNNLRFYYVYFNFNNSCLTRIKWTESLGYFIISWVLTSLSRLMYETTCSINWKSRDFVWRSFMLLNRWEVLFYCILFYYTSQVLCFLQVKGNILQQCECTNTLKWLILKCEFYLKKEKVMCPYQNHTF